MFNEINVQKWYILPLKLRKPTKQIQLTFPIIAFFPTLSRNLKVTLLKVRLSCIVTLETELIYIASVIIIFEIG